MDWRSWCRLCGNYETIIKIEPEIEDIAAKLSVNKIPNYSNVNIHTRFVL